MEHLWNESDRRNQITGRKTYPSTPLCSKNLTWTEMGLNLGVHGDRPVTGTAKLLHGLFGEGAGNIGS
jgi:hypothetical protein